jgi:hypothetical protein
MSKFASRVLFDRLFPTTAKLLVASTAMVFLTAADGGSCNPGDPPPPPEPEPTEPCAPGHHLELVCPGEGVYGPQPMTTGAGGEGAYGPEPSTTTGVGGSSPGCGCQEICVPDGMCPPGEIETWICEDPGYPEPSFCLDPNGCPPTPEPQCYPVCQPIDPCGPGAHEEWICSDAGPCPDPMTCPEPEPYCEPICVPDGLCGPGMHEEWTCTEPEPWSPCLDPAGCPPPEPYCEPTCVPDGPCDPGLDPVIVCDQYGCFGQCGPEGP